MAILEKLTEGIVNRDLQKEGDALLDKWAKTGLLEGLDDPSSRSTMAVLLENQAKELLREASTMSAGDVEGFAAVAFPIVRRVFGNLIANQLVSVQPMSLPSGLIFFLDFTTTDNKLGYPIDSSLYGGGVVGHKVTGGVDLSGDNAERGPYALNNAYGAATSSAGLAAEGFIVIASGAAQGTIGIPGSSTTSEQNLLDKLTRWDPDLSGTLCAVVEVTGATALQQMNIDDLVAINLLGAEGGGHADFYNNCKLVRRLTQISSGSAGRNTQNAGFKLQLTFAQASGSVVFEDGGLVPGTSFMATLTGAARPVILGFPQRDDFTNVSAEGLDRGIGALVGQDTWGLENQSAIPEIDIKVDSVSVTAMTKKLKAKWTPELAQDLNAYHNLDAEVELTSILSEQIALEIDREILEDLIKGAKASTYYWSRRPGRFVNRSTGTDIEDWSSSGIDSNNNLLGGDFTGTVSEWYETLIETINDVSAQIHRKTLRGGANFLVCSPEVANILEFTAGFRASVTADVDTGTAGALKVGAISKKWDVYVDPYFPRNVVLVGRKGSSFLESGYVYAPYVPLQVTPTIFGVEDFVPRKGVMTRYAKKMVRPDMYGLVVVKDLLG